MAFFYEIHSADNTLLKRDGGFASQDAAKIAARGRCQEEDEGRSQIRQAGCWTRHSRAQSGRRNAVGCRNFPKVCDVLCEITPSWGSANAAK
jgi:hypothetical protein